MKSLELMIWSSLLVALEPGDMHKCIHSKSIWMTIIRCLLTRLTVNSCTLGEEWSVVSLSSDQVLSAYTRQGIATKRMNLYFCFFLFIFYFFHFCSFLFFMMPLICYLFKVQKNATHFILIFAVYSIDINTNKDTKLYGLAAFFFWSAIRSNVICYCSNANQVRLWLTLCNTLMSREISCSVFIRHNYGSLLDLFHPLCLCRHHFTFVYREIVALNMTSCY